MRAVAAAYHVLKALCARAVLCTHYVHRCVVAHETRHATDAPHARAELEALVGVDAYDRLNAVIKGMPHASVLRSESAVHVKRACAYFSNSTYSVVSFDLFFADFCFAPPSLRSDKHVAGQTMRHVRVRVLNDQSASAYTTSLCRRINCDTMHDDVITLVTKSGESTRHIIDAVFTSRASTGKREGWSLGRGATIGDACRCDSQSGAVSHRPTR